MFFFGSVDEHQPSLALTPCLLTTPWSEVTTLWSFIWPDSTSSLNDLTRWEGRRKRSISVHGPAVFLLDLQVAYLHQRPKDFPKLQNTGDVFLEQDNISSFFWGGSCHLLCLWLFCLRPLWIKSDLSQAASIAEEVGERATTGDETLLVDLEKTREVGKSHHLTYVRNVDIIL